MFIYIVAKEDHGQPWKLGRTTEPVQRLANLQSGSPVKLVYVKIVEAHLSLEASLHRQFARYRLHGEWFDLPEDQAQLVLARLDGEPWVLSMDGRTKGKRPYRRHGKAPTRKSKKLPRVTGGQGFRLDGP